jgi:hypothetical protein
MALVQLSRQNHHGSKHFFARQRPRSHRLMHPTRSGWTASSSSSTATAQPAGDGAGAGGHGVQAGGAGTARARCCCTARGNSTSLSTRISKGNGAERDSRCINAVALRVRDAAAAYRRALDRGAWAVPATGGGDGAQHSGGARRGHQPHLFCRPAQGVFDLRRGFHADPWR